MYFQGDRIKVFTLNYKGNTSVKEFLDRLTEDAKYEIDKILGLLDDMPRFQHPTKFKVLVRSKGFLIWEVKADQVRIGCFWEENSLYLAHAFTKKGNKWPKNDMDSIQKRCKWFFKDA